MVDTVTKEHRSWVMSRIRSGNTKAEIVVRSMLHRCGYRFSLRRKDLPGKPDIVLPKYKTVVFVHGCFWHWHRDPKCRISKIPKSNTKYWENKFSRNKIRDEKNEKSLLKSGWHVITVWECEVQYTPEAVLEKLLLELAAKGGKRMEESLYDEVDYKKILTIAETKHRYELIKKTGSDKYEDN